ncbi:uncharacterized protein E0L32_002355 [Thyridium curvatum]|uniref:Heterokaryon incompatibility domain-containing protein n=1 Tax=Thyridium curvatum TaxID=1093900 RepID=A0A507APU2_9PEZI|nr:uncharacterized protein E0L32_002355 [Thyridium curvatum]TPX06859.1 hypothetical protein E0L32_002355 [Thyridium curvatum]
MQSLMPYEYAPLQHDSSIRLLLLNPSQDHNADLTGSLLYTTLSEADADIINPYSALSYVWGSPQRSHSIIIDGRRHGITASLDAALRDMRDQSRQHRIWADALCINQDDVEERSRQVRIMGTIYATARNTIIHLGGLTPNVELVFAAAAGTSTRQDEAARREVLTAAALDILQRPWFQRVWVLQELVLSDVPWVQCGRAKVKWDDLAQCLFGRALMDLPKHNQRFKLVHDMAVARGNRWHGNKSLLAHFLTNRRGLGVQEPVDMIFAHVGMASEAHTWRRYVEVDYSTPVRDAYLGAAKYILDQWGVDALLLSAEDDGSGRLRRDGVLPSWVPDWTAKRPAAKARPSDPMPLIVVEDAAPSHSPELHVIVKSSILVHIGRCCGVVEQTCDIPVPTSIPFDAEAVRNARNLLSGLGGLAHNRWQSRRHLATAEEIEEHKRTTTRALAEEFATIAWEGATRQQREKGVMACSQGSTSSLSREQLVAFLSELLLSAAGMAFEQIDIFDEMREYLYATGDSTVLDGRCFARVRGRGWLLVPYGTRAGDVVYRFMNTESRFREEAFILRKWQGPDPVMDSSDYELAQASILRGYLKTALDYPFKHYRLVGQCMVICWSGQRLPSWTFAVLH